VEACQIDSGLWHQSRQPGNEIQRLEDHMRGAIPVRRLELVANVAIRRERQSLLGYRRAALNGDAPHWELWGKWFEKGLQTCGDSVVTDQTALNYMLWKEKLPVYPLPSRCNWACHLAFPGYRLSTGLFHEPGLPGDPIGIMHLTSMMKNKSVHVSGANGELVTVSLRYNAARPIDKCLST